MGNSKDSQSQSQTQTQTQNKLLKNKLLKKF